MQQTALLDTIEGPERDATGTEGAGAPLLARYLQDIGQTPLLSREDEAQLSAEFQGNRAELVRIFLGLPREAKQFALGSVTNPTDVGEWTFADIEQCFERLSRLAEGGADADLDRARREAAEFKRRLESARDTMVRANLKLVTHVAKEYSRNGSPDLDLIQEGNIGLLRAVEKFDHDRGFRFSTYAYWWIKQSIGRAISDKSRTIRIPVHLGRKMRKVQKAFANLADELGRDPTRQELAAETELPQSSIDEVLRIAHGQ